MVARISLNERLKRHPAQNVAMVLLLIVGSLMFASEVFAQGNLTDAHLELSVKAGSESTAIWVGLAILFAVYALIITEAVHRTLAASLGGLFAVLALNYFTEEPTLTLRAVTTMIDWETIGLLLGMMVMVGILSKTGIFEWFAVEAYKKSNGSIWTLVVILCSVTAVLSAFLDNVTTMLLLTPVTIQLAKVLDLKPIPILISEVLFSNVGGAATMIGDPPNIMIGSGLSPDAIAGKGYEHLASSGVTFNDFITEMAPGILMTIVPTFMLVRYLYRDEFAGERLRDVAELESKYGVKDAKLLKISGFILGAVIVGFFLHPIIHISVSWIALLGAVLMLLATDRHDIEESLEKVEWTTLLFFAGLFVLVHSLQYLGVINFIGEYVEKGIQFFPEGEGGYIRLSAAILIILWVSAFASAFIDNIPYTATMIPIVLQISDSLSIELGPLIWALAFGACLGGNGTLIGASANVVTAGISEEAGYPISFKEFFRAGFPVMILTTMIVSVYMIAVYVFSADHTFYAKLVLMGITLVGVVLQISRGKTKGKSFSESLVDDDYDELKEVVIDTIDEMKSTIMAKLSEEE